MSDIVFMLERVMSKQIAKSELQEVISWFKEQFPKAFPHRVADIKPLQLGIMDEIMDFYDRLTYPPFSKKKLRAGLNFYTASPAYLKSQLAGVARIDLFGFESDVVTESQAEYANERFQKYQQTRQKDKLASAKVALKKESSETKKAKSTESEQ